MHGDSPLPSPRERNVWRQVLVASAVALFLLALLGSIRHQQQLAEQQVVDHHHEEVQPVEEVEAEDYEAVIFVTHPKTGTAAALCVVEALQYYMRKSCQHSIMTSYVNENLTGPTTGYYMHLAKSVAFEQFRAVHFPYLMLRTGSAPFETCYDSASRPKDLMSMQHDSVHSGQPGQVCGAECPCNHNVTNCLSLGHCYSSEPFARILWVHVIRHPVDIVLSLYNYHSSSPPVEPWLEEVSVYHYAAYLADSGVDNETMAQAGAYRNEGQSYWRFLRNSSLAHGLQMEFMRSAPGLWKMARLYRRLMALQGRSLVVRYEDLAATPVQGWSQLFHAIRTPCMANHSAPLEEYVTKKCGRDRWRALSRRLSHGSNNSNSSSNNSPGAATAATAKGAASGSSGAAAGLGSTVTWGDGKAKGDAGAGGSLSQRGSGGESGGVRAAGGQRKRCRRTSKAVIGLGSSKSTGGGASSSGASGGSGSGGVSGGGVSGGGGSGSGKGAEEAKSLRGDAAPQGSEGGDLESEKGAGGGSGGGAGDAAGRGEGDGREGYAVAGAGGQQPAQDAGKQQGEQGGLLGEQEREEAAGREGQAGVAAGAGEREGRRLQEDVGCEEEEEEEEGADGGGGSEARRAAQVDALLSNTYIRHQVCQLERILGYSTYARLCSAFHIDTEWSAPNPAAKQGQQQQQQGGQGQGEGQQQQQQAHKQSQQQQQQLRQQGQMEQRKAERYAKLRSRDARTP